MEKLGIQPVVLLAQVINFLLVVFVLNKFLYKPVLHFLEKRKKEIAEGLAISESMKTEKAELEAKKAKVLELARKDAQALLVEAKKLAKEEAQQIVEKAHKDAGQILEKAKKDAESTRKELEKQVQDEAVDIAVAILEKAVPELLTSEAQKKLVVKRLSSAH